MIPLFTDTATPLEVTYTLLMVVTLVVTTINFMWSRQRLIELRKLGQNGLLLIMRKGAQSDQLTLVAVSMCLVIIGLNTLVLPANPRVPSFASTIIGVAFLVMSVLIMFMSLGIRLRPAQLRAEAKLT